MNSMLKSKIIGSKSIAVHPVIQLIDNEGCLLQVSQTQAPGCLFCTDNEC